MNSRRRKSRWKLGRRKWCTHPDIVQPDRCSSRQPSRGMNSCSRWRMRGRYLPVQSARFDSSDPESYCSLLPRSHTNWAAEDTDIGQLSSLALPGYRSSLGPGSDGVTCRSWPSGRRGWPVGPTTSSRSSAPASTKWRRKSKPGASSWQSNSDCSFLRGLNAYEVRRSEARDLQANWMQY